MGENIMAEIIGPFAYIWFSGIDGKMGEEVWDLITECLDAGCIPLCLEPAGQNRFRLTILFPGEGLVSLL